MNATHVFPVFFFFSLFCEHVPNEHYYQRAFHLLISDRRQFTKRFSATRIRIPFVFFFSSFVAFFFCLLHEYMISVFVHGFRNYSMYIFLELVPTIWTHVAKVAFFYFIIYSCDNKMTSREVEVAAKKNRIKMNHTSCVYKRTSIRCWNPIGNINFKLKQRTKRKKFYFFSHSQITSHKIALVTVNLHRQCVCSC